VLAFASGLCGEEYSYCIVYLHLVYCLFVCVVGEANKKVQTFCVGMQLYSALPADSSSGLPTSAIASMQMKFVYERLGLNEK
jgi:hypothetical protein